MKRHAKERYITTSTSFLLVITAVVDPHYLLSVFPSKLKEKVEWEAVANGGQKIKQAWGSSTWWISHISAAKDHNPQLILIQNIFLVSIILKQRKKQYPRKTSNNILQMTRLSLKLRGFWPLLQKWNSGYAGGTQNTRQLCKEISFGTSIFCAFWSWQPEKAQSLISKNRRKAFISSPQVAKTKTICL